MNKPLGTEFSGLTCNLRLGCRALFFKQSELDRYHISYDQIILLVIFYTTISFICSYFLNSPKPEVSIYGVANITTQISAIALATYLITKQIKISEAFLPLFIVFLNIWILFYLAWIIIGADTNFSVWQFYGEKKILYTIYNMWILSVFTYTAAHLVGYSAKNVIRCLATYLLILGIPLHYLSVGQFWYPSYEYESETDKYASVNQENTYYKQFDFIEDFKKHTLPERPGVSDIYFVGFGSYGAQDVFMKEVKYVKNLFDDRYDTRDRSVALINNLKTVDNYPLATKNNLNIALNHIGKLMNAEEDVLFLYLTSHGSKQHELSVDFMPLALNELNPQDLKASLDNAQIKYRVLLVSACYSGGFVEPLKNEYTLVMTAAAHDRQSFGCGNKSEFTYFGKAVFEEQLSSNYNFIDAFRKAITSIGAREKREKHTPSKPQLFIGKKIEEKLNILSIELKQFSNKNNSKHSTISKKTIVNG